MTGLTECIHGQLARACTACELESEIMDWQEKYNTLLTAVKNLRSGNTDGEYEQLMALIGEEK